MIESIIIPYCVLYKGEHLCKYEHHDAAIWAAERSACTDLSCMIDLNDIPRTLYNVVDGLIGKWCPMEYGVIMQRYNELRYII